jgi:hypothetical protein
MPALLNDDQFRRRSFLGIYRFHVRDGAGLFEDNEGIELPDLHAALAAALRSANEFLAEAYPTPGMQFEIADGTGRVVLKVPIVRKAPTAYNEAA